MTQPLRDETKGYEPNTRLFICPQCYSQFFHSVDMDKFIFRCRECKAIYSVERGKRPNNLQTTSNI